MTTLPQSFVSECKHRLLEAKTDILNRIDSGRKSLIRNETTGDAADQSSRLMQENELMSFHAQWKRQLMEIEKALSRIENGTYGICEETEEPIEASRLKALPWTRYSLEGAELRDSK